MSSRRGGPSRGNFGRGGGRGRGGGGGRGGYGERQSPNDGESSGEASDGNRPPPGLTGRDLGLWYRNRQFAKNKESNHRERPPPGLRGKQLGLWHSGRFRVANTEREWENLPKVELDTSKQGKITDLLRLLEDHSSNSSTPKHSAFLERYKQHLFHNVEASAVEVTEQGLSNFEYLGRKSELDSELLEDLTEKQGSQKYQNMMKFREKLPAYKHKDEFLKLVTHNQVIVISGETGCGKTTQCCQLILDEMIQQGNGSLCNIVCTQPRRISAVSVAERVADERDERIGRNSVGYSIRLESRLPSRERGTILFCTTGIIFQYLKTDPSLSTFSHIVVDEIHERDVLSDFLLAVLKDLIRIRPSLKVILMSATINAEHFSKYFNNCPCFNIPGFTFPVQEYFLEDVLAKTRFKPEMKEDDRRGGGGGGGFKNNRRNDQDMEYSRMLDAHIRKLERERTYPAFVTRYLKAVESENQLNLDLVEALIRHICETDQNNGAILIFVPGWDQISKLNTQLLNGGFSASRYLIIPLHSLMPTMNQKEVFSRPTGGRRKIIISTNIAETSITIDDIVYVVDTGKLKITNYDLNRNLQTLDTEWVSLANATQRRGRAGRVQEGVCFHLFSKAKHMALESFKLPEVLRKRLEEVVLQIKMLRLGSAGQFLDKLIDPPSRKAVDLAVKRLVQLQALDDEENLTPLGFHLAHLPMDPQTGKMILMAGIFGCVDPILTVAASLSFKDAFYTPLGLEKKVDNARHALSRGTKSDHMVSVYAMEGYERACRDRVERDYCYRNFLSSNTMHLLENMKRQFANHLHEMKFVSSDDYKEPSSNVNSDNIGLVTAIICAGLYPNVAQVQVKRRRDGTCTFPKVRTPEDGKVDIHPKSVNKDERDFPSPYFVYFEKMKSGSLFLYDTTMVSPFPLIFFGGQLRFRKEKRLGIVSVDHNIEFRVDQPIFEVMEALRKQLDMLLEEKIQNPRPTCWNELSKEGALLRATIELITAEYREMLGEPALDDSDSEDD